MAKYGVKLILLIFILCFSGFACDENYDLEPGFIILKELRDSGENVEQSLKELELGRNQLYPETLVNWKNDKTPVEQIHLYGLYLRRSLVKKENDFRALDFERPYEKSLYHFSAQTLAYQKALWSYRKTMELSSHNVIEEVMSGETFYIIRNKTDQNWGAKIQMYNEGREFTKSIHLDNFVSDGQKFRLREDLSVQIQFQPVEHNLFKDSSLEMMRIKVNQI